MASVKCFDETGISYSLPYSESEDSHLRCSTILGLLAKENAGVSF